MRSQWISRARRTFLKNFATIGGVTAAVSLPPTVLSSPAQGRSMPDAYPFLPWYTRTQSYRSLKQSSFDTTGGNDDNWPIEGGKTQEVFNQKGPGIITHIWFTIAAQSRDYLIWQNQDYWAGEGDEMIFVDDENRPVIVGTGSEDYFCGAWNFGGSGGATPFAHLYNGAPYILAQERVGGRYVCYRWHADNPVTFSTYMKHTIEHGHANHRADNFFSCCYWYQTEPHLQFPAMAPLQKRIPAVYAVGTNGALTP